MFHHFQNPTVSDFDRRVASFHSCSGCLFMTSIFGVVRLSSPLESVHFADSSIPYAFAHSQDALAHSRRTFSFSERICSFSLRICSFSKFRHSYYATQQFHTFFYRFSSINPGTFSSFVAFCGKTNKGFSV